MRLSQLEQRLSGGDHGLAFPQPAPALVRHFIERKAKELKIGERRRSSRTG
jgi:hypothetical protein